MNQSRFKSKLVWSSIVGLILLVLNTFGVFKKIEITESQILNIFDLLLAILVSVGILNNPTDKNNF